MFILLFVASSAMAQNRTITGTVTSKEDGLPLPGVSVKVKGASIGASTGANGRFSLSVPASATVLEFSSLGFLSQTANIGSGNTINVSLETDAKALTEVVVTGYGTGRPVGTIVGSVATVSSRVVDSKPTANAFDALQGQVAGLQLFSSSGEPSVASSLRLHGVGSLGASNTPLVLLDGAQVDPNVIVSLNPNDFESISVLKDASATSIYGARAANGVIYITTKKGRVGQPTMSIQQQYSESSIAYDKFFKNVMNTAELAAFQVKQGVRTQAATDALLAQYPNDFKWYDYYHKNGAPTYQTDFNISGGANKTTYYISGSYLNAEGIRYRSAYDRYTIRANVNTEISSYLKAGLILSGGTDNRQLNGWGSNSTNGGLALLAQPWFSPYKADGSEYYGETIAGLGRYAPNYLADMMPDDYNRLQFNPSAYLTLTPIAGLTLKTQGGMDGTIERNTWGTRPVYAGSPGNGSLDESYSRNIIKTWTNTAEYKFNFGQNNFTALAGHEYVDGTNNSFSAGTAASPFNEMWLLQNGNATNRRVSSGKSEYAFNSFFGRLEYNFKNRYYLDGSIREDKSSRFGSERQSATFWSIGGMWRMKEESFLKDVSWLDDMSLRASHGTSGNSAIGNYEHLQTAAATTNYTNNPALAINQAGNAELGWEKQTKTTVGLTTGFFNRVRLTVEYYFRKTTDQLINVPQPFTTGWANIRYNIGTIQNSGFDVTLDVDAYKNNTAKAFVTPYFNANFNKNKITELFQGKQTYIIPNTGVLWAVGQPVSFSYPIWAGVNAANGAPQWYLPNSGEAIANPRKDPSAITNNFSTALEQNTGIERYPWLNGGFGFRSGYKGLYMDVDFSFSLGKYLINNDRYFFENPTQFPGFNQSPTVLDYWTPQNTDARFPSLSNQFTQFDSRLIENASFLRLKAVQIGWNLPESILKSVKVVKGARIFLVGRNILTVTDYTGPDPEVDSNLALGTNPNTRQFGMGLQLRF